MPENPKQSRYPKRSIQIATGYWWNSWTTQSSPIQCEFSGMNCKFLWIQTLTSFPELLGSKYKILLFTEINQAMKNLSSLGYGSIKHHRTDHTVGALKGTLESITSNPHLYPWIVTDLKYHLNYSTFIQQILSKCLLCAKHYVIRCWWCPYSSEKQRFFN